MYRTIINQLAEWTRKEQHKPLCITGAMGVGKTWALLDFAEGFFEHKIQIDLREQEYARYLFEGDMNRERILRMLRMVLEDEINPDTTMILLENIDAVKKPYQMMKFFHVFMNEFHICTTSRMGKEVLFDGENVENIVEIIEMYPLSFEEFLIINKEAVLCEKIQNYRMQPLAGDTLERLEEYVRIYLVTGGMPSVVETWIQTQDIEEVKREQARLLSTYWEEFERVEDVTLRKKIIQVFKSAGKQLDKENKKFQYGVVKLTARAREYYDAVKWLLDRNFLSKVECVKEPVFPLANHVDEKAFETFLPDVGFLSWELGITLPMLQEGDKPLLCRNQSLAEQFVYQELRYNSNVPKLYYWVSQATAKIEFLFEDAKTVIPLEMNLYGNTKAQNLKVYMSRYPTSMAIRITHRRLSREKGIFQLPIYSIWNL